MAMGQNCIYLGNTGHPKCHQLCEHNVILDPRLKSVVISFIRTIVFMQPASILQYKATDYRQTFSFENTI